MLTCYQWLLLVSLLGLTIACEKEKGLDHNTQQRTPSTSQSRLAITNQEANTLASHLWQQGQAALADTQKQVAELQQRLDAFLDNPTEQTLQEARQQWHATYTQYQLLAPFLYIQPAENSPPQRIFARLDQARFSLAAWPIQPGYIDGYRAHIHSGIVHDTSIPITIKNLRKQHGLTADEEAVLGLHAIEFLLWRDKELSLAEHFVAKENYTSLGTQLNLKTHELPDNRRRALLKIQAQLLLNDVNQLQTQWQKNGALFASFQKLIASEKIIAINNGFYSYISQLHNLFTYYSNIDNEENVYFNQFAGEREKTAAVSIAKIYTYYINDDLSLSKALLSNNNEQTLKTALKSLQAQLKQTDTNYSTITISLNDIKNIFSLKK